MTNCVTFEQIKASLGSLLLLWSAIERKARDEVSKMHDGCLPKSAHGISRVLTAWEEAVTAKRPEAPFCALLATALRTQIQEPLNVRNGVCHGLLGISSEHSVQPAALIWQIDQKERSITWKELQTMLSWLSKIPLALSMISASSTERTGSRLLDNTENRKWWLTEFGIDLHNVERITT